MRIVFILLYAIEVITCLLLVAAVLLQRGKDSGTGLSFGSSMGEAMFGAQVGNVLAKATIILGSIFLANTLLLSILVAKGKDYSLVPAKYRAPSVPASSMPSSMPSDEAPLGDMANEPIPLESEPVTAP
jgi:preprotein translocase subunit SecG